MFIIAENAVILMENRTTGCVMAVETQNGVNEGLEKKVENLYKNLFKS